jgi:hypothetical protein
MLVEINVRGNGACPICKFTDNCNIQETLKKALEQYSGEDNIMEMVIFSCPKFREKQ